MPIPVGAAVGDFIIAWGLARQNPADSFYSFGPGIWFEEQGVGSALDGPTDPDPFLNFCVRKIYAGETDLVLTPVAPAVNHVQTVLQVWRGAAQLFAGPVGEYEDTAGTSIPASLPKSTDTIGLGGSASPTAIIGGNIAFCVVLAYDATDIQFISSEGFVNSVLESNIRIDVRGYTQGEGGSVYSIPTYSLTPGSWMTIYSNGFSGAPDPVNPAEWPLPALEWSATGSVTPFVSTGGVKTKRFDDGDGSEWYIVAPVSDSGHELRAKVIKPARVTGKLTNAALKIYTYDVSANINVADLEAGTNSTTGAIALPGSTQVAQSPLMSVDCPNAVLSTIRVEGDGRGEAMRDQVHEIVYQQAVQGVRR